jgi:hypothetical protein
MMKSGSAKFLELVERRLELLRTLVLAEGEWRRAFIALDMQGSQRRAAEEDLLCEQIRALDKEITSLQASPANSSNLIAKKFEIGWSECSEADPIFRRSIRAAMDQMTALHLDLKHSNQTKRAILKRSKLTISALHNLFNSYAPTYSAPPALTVGTIYQENV